MFHTYHKTYKLGENELPTCRILTLWLPGQQSNTNDHTTSWIAIAIASNDCFHFIIWYSCVFESVSGSKLPHFCVWIEY